MSRERWIEALAPLQEPSLGIGLTEYNLIRDILIREDRVSLTVVLSERTEDAEALISGQIAEIAHELGHQDVHVRFREMTDYERNEVREKLSGSQAEQPASQRKHADYVESDVLSPNSGVTFIAVASGKGGVGKSTVTVNLAAALARQGKKVGIIDADIYGFSVPDMMGITERPPVTEGKVIPVERFGVKVMSMGFFVEDNAPVIWRGPMLGKMLRNFFHEVNWGRLDVLLLDLPPGTGDIALDVHQMIPHSKEVLVTTPHATASFVAARAGSMAVRTEHEILGVVENMAYYQCSDCGKKDYVFGRGGGAKLADELHTELLAQIPLGAPDNHPQEPEFSPSVYKPDTEIGRIYDDMAKRVLGKI